MPTPIVKSAIDSLKSTIRLTRDRQRAIRTHSKLLNRYLGRFAAFMKADLARYQPSLSVTEGYPGWDFHVQMSTKELEGFKQRELVALLGKFIDADETKTEDWAEYHNRDYRFTYKLPGDIRIVVLINAYVRADSQSCRRVFKGKKTEVVERDEFELVCD